MSEKILVVDDSLTARHVMIDILSETDFEIDEAANGLEGLDKLQKMDNVKLIFTDLNMPEMNGPEMIREIRQKEHLKNIPICLFTTKGDGNALEAAKELGVNAFLVKPALHEHVISVVKSFTSKK